MKLKTQFERLAELGKFMTIFGWVTVGMSVLLGVVSIGAFAEGLSRQAAVVMGLLIVIVGSVSGIIMAAFGHVMLYFVGVEPRVPISVARDSGSSGEKFEIPQSVAA